MQIEFLETGSPDCPLIRLYGVERKYFTALHDEILRLAADSEGRCPVHEIPGFQAHSDCRLTLISSSKNEDVRRLGPGLDFAWRLSPANWSVVGGLLEPFCTDFSEGRYQWLAGGQARHGLDRPGISVLLSCSSDGHW